MLSFFRTIVTVHGISVAKVGMAHPANFMNAYKRFNLYQEMI